MTCDVYDETTAPDAARPPLARTIQRFGDVLNVAGADRPYRER